MSEVERLRAELIYTQAALDQFRGERDRLRAVLERISGNEFLDLDWQIAFIKLQDIAREAITQKGTGT